MIHRRFIALCLALCLVFGMSTAAYAGTTVEASPSFAAINGAQGVAVDSFSGASVITYPIAAAQLIFLIAGAICIDSALKDFYESKGYDIRYRVASAVWVCGVD